MEKKRIFTVPNVLSMLRIVLVFVFVYLYFTGRKTLAFSVLAVSCLSDTLDGYIARRFDQVTDLGKALDPVADKLFTVSTLLCLCCGKMLPWWYAGILLGKELFMLIGGAVFIKKTGKVIAARWYGKVTTVCVFTTLIFAMILDAVGLFLPENAARYNESALQAVRYGLVGLCVLGSVLALFSLIAYTVSAVRVYRDVKASQEGGAEDASVRQM